MSSGKFRSRRPPTPPPVNSGLGSYPPKTSQRFPYNKEDHLDADERLHTARLDGSVRKPYQQHHPHPVAGIKMTSLEWKLLIVICLIAVSVRLFRISKPDSVVFDEVHFGKFASKYIKTQYYVDVHPPLAKLLITLAAFVGGYDGNFDFKDIGKVYDNVPYILMRLVPGILGVALVPLTYLTLRGLDCHAITATLGSLFVTFENGLITQSRHILLDSPLVFFTGLTTFLWVGFCNENRHKPFTEPWWIWLTLSGLSLGAVVSCKWVGLFTIATVGLSTIRQLWILLGDLRVTPRMWIKHFLARAVCLILIPILFYMAMFEIHFLILENSGDGDGFMSSEFQHTLGGRGMSDTFSDVALGSTITIRHADTQGGYLHSHVHNYPTGSKQQQITLYPHRDQNNDWLITNITKEGEKEFDYENNPLEYVTPHMVLRLQHVSTQKRLHSHDFRPPISETDFQNEVSAYGFEGFQGDANDYWIFELYQGDKKDRDSFRRLKTLRTRFRLRHQLTGCYLFSHKIKLPDWGFEQQEVTCNKNAPKKNSIWYVETNTHPKLPPNAPKVNYRLPGFLSKFLELQQVMWTTNAGLTERHNFDSRPQDWPRLKRGINFWVKDHRQIYLIGNPWVWWLSTLSILFYVGVRGFLIIRAKRGYQDFNNSRVVKYDELCGFLFMGWFLHYFPFYIMARQLFLHHYFPALYFAILLFCSIFDFSLANAKLPLRLQIAAVFIIIAILNYTYLSPLAYGSPWTKSKCNHAKWLKTWDFACNDFLDDYSQYKPGVAAPTPVKSPVVTVGGEGDGRATVVVEAPKSEELEIDTSILANQPEPGRDVFEQPQAKEFTTTKSVKQEELQMTTEKIVETVIPVEPPAPPQPPPPVGHRPEFDTAKDDTEKKHGDAKQPPPIEAEKPAAPVPPPVEAKAPAPKPAGPKDEADSERQRVMNDLYPDA